MSTTSEARTLEARLTRLDGWLHRHRNYAGPPAVGVLVFATAVGVHLLATRVDGWWWALAAGIVCFVALIGLRGAQTLPNVTEQRVATCGWLCGAGWVTIAGYVPPWQPWPMVALFLAGLGPLWALWAHHRRVRRGVQVGVELGSWGDGKGVGLDGTEMVEAAGKAGNGWWSVPIRGKGDKIVTYAKIVAQRANIAALYRVSEDDIEFKRYRGEFGAWVTVRHDRAATEVGLTARVPAERASVAGPKEVGRTTNGSPACVELYNTEAGGRDGAALGSKGSGKSSYSEELAIPIVASTDALAWVVDLKPGAQHWRRWRRGLDWFIDTPGKLDTMFAALSALMDHRGALGTGRTVQVGPGQPYVWVFIDESSLAFYAAHSADAQQTDRATAYQRVQDRTKLIQTRIQVSRSFGIGVYMATQRNVVDAFGNGTIHGELTAGNYAVFRTSDAGQTQIPGLPEGVKPAKFDQGAPGTCYLSTPVFQGKARVHPPLSDAQVTQLVDRFPVNAPDAARFSDAEAAAMRSRIGPVFDHRHDDLPPVTRVAKAQPVPESEQSPIPESPRRLNPEQSRAMILATLQQFGTAQVHEVAAACGRSAPLVRSRLNELVEDGRVTRQGTGRWTKYRVTR